MRIYLPMTPEDRTHLAGFAVTLDLAAGRSAWAVTEEARADRPGEDDEDLEYDAIQDAVHIALGRSAPEARAMVIAADVPGPALEPAGESGGAYGVVVRTATPAKIASFHVTELDARSAADDDTDPALLWFDASEGPRALAYLKGAATG